jgi:hypothetical protein
MSKETINFNASQVLMSLYDKYKGASWILSNEEITSKCNRWLGRGKFGNYKIKLFKGKHKFGLISGITLNEHNDLDFVADNDFEKNTSINISNLSLEVLHSKITLVDNGLKIRYGFSYFITLRLSTEEKNFFNEFFSQCEKTAESLLKKNQDKKRLKKEKLDTNKVNMLSSFDKDKNGEIDLIENDFNKLFSKNQKLVMEVDKNYIHQFVKVTNFIKTKRLNTQKIFESIQETSTQKELEERANLLKNQIHAYEILVFHSINMIGALISENLITFYEIYESFDKLGMFNSNWENEVSEKLTNIGDKLDDLMYSIYKMEQNIIGELSHLSYVTQESFEDLNRSVTNQLKEVESSINTNNLLTGIQAYQLYKINKNTKSLRP